MTNDSSSRIVAALRQWVAEAAPGAKLPSTRQLVAEYHASPVTVQKALQALASQGLIDSRPGVGTFVRAVRTARPSDYGWQTAALRSPSAPLPPSSGTMRTVPAEAIWFHSGYPDRELLPERLVRSALARAARGDAALSRPPAAGMPELQQWFAQELGSATPAGTTPPTPSDVIVLPGSQSGLSSIFRALVGAGQPLLIESPSYWGAILAAAQTGVRLVPVPTGPDGPDPADVDRAFTETGARAFYVQPNYSNPTGGQWAPGRGDEILDVAHRHGAFLVEDDWAHDFGITSNPLPLATRDDSGHVVYIRSLTKSVSTAIRIAAVIVRGPARERILGHRAAESMYVSGLLQAAALDVVTQPGWQTHLRSLRQQLQSRRDLLATSIREHVPQAHIDNLPKGGLNLWVRLPDTTDLPRLARDCEDAGVIIAAGTEWFPAESAGAFIRLNYSGPNPGAYPEGARIIGEAMARNSG
ncbi:MULTISPECIES: aminotransferase-like domain-containing protein [Pseudarthrobacter]|uniref:DNA-binding transcriptional MocR family regulator n=1 Tax=Pseudarthrobacter niigatensis TaxID=369935 RepID=A0AAJ1SY51_9MICC|nr:MULTISPECIES: PLP-dependent aminotransferase family protein [Pseudarthrobacter]MDQ0146811.1 DNA-binding transcriptional MocR family regulator [Pseudarthrobacter niigatensis]MDQ0264643.1 DNA-binding transcriptional MocR family regulator [Pseudarthrobacter niigatensis]QDG87562.1 PLP-dependent aminotransferase family protein [Pseudarthrobacter sp. NIBRBAC000502770]